MIRRLPSAGSVGRLGLLCGLLVAAVASCAGERPSVSLTPTNGVGTVAPTSTSPVSASKVGTTAVADSRARALVDQIRAWGIRINETEAIVADPFLFTSSAAYATETSSLFVFPYSDDAEARAAADEVPPDADDSHLRWADDVDYFLCGHVIVLQFGPDGRAGHALRDICGPPFASGKGRL